MVGLIAPLGLDTLGVAIVLGIAGFPVERRLQPLRLLLLLETTTST